jgi:hypothetical protein
MSVPPAKRQYPIVRQPRMAGNRCAITKETRERQGMRGHARRNGLPGGNQHGVARPGGAGRRGGDIVATAVVTLGC